MTERRRLTRLQRTKIFDGAKGICCLCKLPILASRGERWIVEHIVPLWLSGDDDESNMGPAHERCAIEKTVGEAPVKAKSDRVRARHLGIRKTKKRGGFLTNKDGPFKRKVTGELIRRNVQATTSGDR
jgi:5-methylcytosine-specific restriction enzyme A